jgi:hypothetical protein
MNLTTINNIHFTFQIVGRESKLDDWLLVKVSYWGNGIKHSYTDPALTMEEIDKLSIWFEKIFYKDTPERRFITIDQMIFFRFFGYEKGKSKIQLELNSQYNNTGNPLKLNFLMSKVEIIKWIKELRDRNY